MKTKRVDKKLVLNKKTVAHLHKGDMNSVKGGEEYCASIPLPTCVSFKGWTCPTNDPSIVGPICCI